MTIELWAFPLDRAPPADPGDAARARAARYRDPDIAARFLNSRGWVALLLGDRDPQRASWARSGDLGVFAYCEDRRIGVDVERLRIVDDIPALSLAHLDVADRDAIWRAADPNAAFLGAWTALEARCKACGTGLSVTPPRLPVAPFHLRRRGITYVGALANHDAAIAPRWADPTELESACPI